MNLKPTIAAVLTPSEVAIVECALQEIGNQPLPSMARHRMMQLEKVLWDTPQTPDLDEP